MSAPSDQKVAVVTGGARRLGADIAKGLAATGWRVVVHYRHSADEAAATVEAIEQAGGRGVALGADLSRAADVEALREQTLEAFGRVDALIANASTFRRTPLSTLSPEDWHEQVDNNLTVSALTAISFGRWMKAHGGGAIVCLADSAGERPWRDYLPYSVAKAGVIALTRGLAKELAPEVRVNAIVPGPMLFPEGFDAEAQRREVARTLLQRAGEPRHITAAVLFLLTHDYITGALLPVDGGRSLA